MKNFISEGNNITIASAPYARASGEGVQVGAGLFGVAVNDCLISAEVVISREGVFELAKDDSTLVAGALIYWDNSAKVTTGTASTNLKIGVAIADAGEYDETVLVALTPV